MANETPKKNMRQKKLFAYLKKAFLCLGATSCIHKQVCELISFLWVAWEAGLFIDQK